jgi:GNAT superfamily N-acetyltransferase
MAFVRDSWLESFRTTHGAGLVPMSRYFAVYREVLSELMARHGTEVIVAFKPGELPPDDLYGYIALERGYPHPKRGQAVDLVHYLFVKQAYRGLGVGRSLVEVAKLRWPWMYTALTPNGQRFKSHYPGVVFDPLAARYGRDGAGPKQPPHEDGT